MQQQIAAIILAKKEGVSGEKLKRRVQEVLNKSDDARLEAETEATRDWSRRVEVIIDQARPRSLGKRPATTRYRLRSTIRPMESLELSPATSITSPRIISQLYGLSFHSPTSSAT